MASPPETARAETTEHVLERRMPRVDSLTGLRWWAAFAVFAYHMLNFAPLPPLATTFLHYGYFGVTFFFVLSGFVLMWSLAPRVKISTFYWRRVARIYPAHVVALVVAIPVFYTLGTVPADSWLKPFDAVALLLSLVLLQGWVRDPVVFFSGNPAAWSLTYEAFFYAAFPFVAKALTPWRKRGALVFVAVVTAVFFAYRILVALYPDSPLPAVPWPIQHLPEFVIGMALAWAFRCGWLPRIPVVVGVGSLVLLLAAIALAPRFIPGTGAAFVLGGFSNELVTVACALAITAVAGASVRGRRSLLALRPMVKLGEWSFAFYLVHATFIYLALTVFGLQPAGWRNVGWYAVVLAVSIAGAAALHLLVEKPLERRMRAWKDRRDARPRQGELEAVRLP